MDIELKEGDTLYIKVPYANASIVVACQKDHIGGWLDAPRLRPWPQEHRTKHHFGTRIEQPKEEKVNDKG